MVYVCVSLPFPLLDLFRMLARGYYSMFQTLLRSVFPLLTWKALTKTPKSGLLLSPLPLRYCFIFLSHFQWPHFFRCLSVSLHSQSVLGLCLLPVHCLFPSFTAFKKKWKEKSFQWKMKTVNCENILFWCNVERYNTMHSECLLKYQWWRSCSEWLQFSTMDWSEWQVKYKWRI